MTPMPRVPIRGQCARPPAPAGAAATGDAVGGTAHTGDRSSPAPLLRERGFWVFGYGSLIWKPGFPYLERRPARLKGYRRAFRLTSIRYRGTPERPGLVLGLDWDPNATCTGVAFRVCPTRDEEVRDYLAERELVTRSYFEVLHPITLLGDPEIGRLPEEVEAICYILDRTHPQYAGPIGLDEQAAIIAAAHGPMGSNAEYLHETAAALRAMGIVDRDIDTLDTLVRTILAEAAKNA
ncbi:MAG: gamma-glutamylcyclotransferase [Pseudomonadota bacterium]